MQGFGNVGSHAARHPVAASACRLIAVGDHTGYLYNPEGFNPHKLQDCVRGARLDRGLPGRQARSRARSSSRIKADIFVPAALENQIGDDEANALQVRLVAEGANGPCTPEGETILLERGIDVLPDVLANAGGVTVSYYEWVQNKRSRALDLEEVDDDSRRR